MGTKSFLSENKRDKIVTLFNEGYSERQISVKVSCKTAVHNSQLWISKLLGVFVTRRDVGVQGKPVSEMTT